MLGGYREITSYYLYHGDKTFPVDKILSFDIDTTDTHNQQLFHGYIIPTQNKPITYPNLHFTTAILAEL
jgi:hypothetical protein